MIYPLPTNPFVVGSEGWRSVRRSWRLMGRLSGAYVKRDTMGPVKPDQGLRSYRNETGMMAPARHRGGLTVAPAPRVPQIPAAFLPVSATRHVVTADEPAMFGILDPQEEAEILTHAADLYRKSEKEND